MRKLLTIAWLLFILDMGLATFFSVLFVFIDERGLKEVFGRDGGVLKVKYLGFWAYFRLLGLERLSVSHWL